MIRNFILLSFLILWFHSLHAQYVETLTSHAKIVDGLYVDPLGDIYTSSGGLVNGNEIGKYDISNNSYDWNFANGFAGPINISGYRDSLLIVSNYDNNSVSQYNLNTGLVSTIGTAINGFDGPAGIAIDQNDNIFVTNFGKPPTYNGHTIQKIHANGAILNYIDSSALLRPQAMCFNHQNELIVHSDKILYKVNPQDSTLHSWVNLGFEVGNMKLRMKDSCIYAAAGGTKHQIIKITPQGTFSTFAGSTFGYIDGQTISARFQHPLGVAFSPEEDTLYISEAIGRLRRIIMTTTSVLELSNKYDLNINPNPANQLLKLESSDIIRTFEIRIPAGAVLLKREFNTKKIEIDVSEIPNGLYLISTLSRSGIRYTKKLIIQH